MSSARGGSHPPFPAPREKEILSGSFLRHRLLSGSAWASARRIGGAMFGIVTTGLLACMLSEQEFGAYFLALSIVSLGAVVGSLGLPNTVVGKEDFPKFAPQYCSLAPDSAAGHVLVG